MAGGGRPELTGVYLFKDSKFVCVVCAWYCIIAAFPSQFCAQLCLITSSLVQLRYETLFELCVCVLWSKLLLPALTISLGAGCNWPPGLGLLFIIFFFQGGKCNPRPQLCETYPEIRLLFGIQKTRLSYPLISFVKWGYSSLMVPNSSSWAWAHPRIMVLTMA